MNKSNNQLSSRTGKNISENEVEKLSSHVCSFGEDEVENVCSTDVDDTLRVNRTLNEDRYVKTLEFRHVTRFFRFDKSDRKTYKKAILDEVNVSVVLDVVTGNI